MTCTGCPHLPHPGACVHCGCAIVTLVSEGCGCNEIRGKMDRLVELVEHLTARVELALDDLLQQHESHRRVPELVARVEALEVRAARTGNGEAP